MAAASIYVPLFNAATLEGLTYRGMQSRLNRNRDSYAYKLEPPGQHGGRPRILVALSSLSKIARRRYKTSLNTDGGEAVIESKAGSQEPWYLDVDIAWYIETHPQRYQEAVELSGRIHGFVNYTDGERTVFGERFARDLGISLRSLYRYAGKYLEASAWALKLEREDGHNYDHLKVLALCRKPKESGTFPSLPPEQRAFLENLWFDRKFAGNRGTVEMLYDKFEETARLRGWSYPSYQTVARYIKHLMEDKGYRNAHKLAADGLKAWKRDVMVKGIRDSSQVPVMGLLQGDAHKFDFWVKYTDPANGKVSAIRPVVIAWIDTRSRKVMGAIMAKSINAQITKHSLLKVAYSEGIPECILVDNGKEFTAREILGRGRNQRSFHDRLEIPLDSEAKGFLKSLGVKDDFRSLPYQPWGKGQIERFFLTVCNQFSKWFTSYTGTLTGSRTAAKVHKDTKRMLEQDKLISLEECYQRFAIFLEKYHNKKHRGLKEMHEQWVTPQGLFQNAGERYVRPAPPLRYAEVLLQKAERVWVSSTGIKRFGQLFMDPDLEPYIGTHVKIRWNPEDLTRIIAYTMKGKRICQVQSQPYLRYFASPEETEQHKRKQNRHLAGDRDLLREATTPYENRVGDAAVAGKLDFMVENENPQPAVSLPDDRQYRDEAGAAKGKKAGGNQFFDKKAEKALSKLRAMGE